MTSAEVELEDDRRADRDDDVVEHDDVVGGVELAVGAGVARVPRPLVGVDLDADHAGLRLGALEVEEGPEHEGRAVVEQVPVDHHED